jgi:hypothetical protein
MRAVKWLTVLGVFAGVLLAAWYWVRQTTHVSWGYCVEARFAALPVDDKPLCEWLKTQPGVVPDSTVSVTREGPDGKLLKVSFIQVRNLAGNPPFPGLDAACMRLGYSGPDSPFRDCVNPYGSFVPCE